MPKIIHVDEDTLVDDGTILWEYSEAYGGSVSVSYSSGEKCIRISDGTDWVEIYVNDIRMLIKSLTLADKHIIDSEQQPCSLGNRVH